MSVFVHFLFCWIRNSVKYLNKFWDSEFHILYFENYMYWDYAYRFSSWLDKYFGSFYKKAWVLFFFWPPCMFVYLKRIKFNTGFILERSNLVVLILVPWEILKIFFPVSQMIWMQNLIEMKNNAIVMVLEVLNMSQTFSLDLNSLLKYFF